MKSDIMTQSARRLVHTLLLIVFLGAGAPLTAAADEASSTLRAGFTALHPGDALDLRFLREPALDGEYVIDDRGIALLPLLGEYHATGKPLNVLRQSLLDGYSRELASAGVRVTPLRRIPILGAVRNPGIYRVDATVRVADALALAGGASEDGRRDQVVLVRNGHKIPIAVNGKLPGSGQFRSGDQILVQQRSWVARNSATLVSGLISATAIIYAAGR